MHVFLARPRLDCSFKQGEVPAQSGPPLNLQLARFGEFINRLERFHLDRGDVVTVEERPLWQFDLQSMQAASKKYDRIYFPHKLRREFHIGDNAIYYKNSPLRGYVTVDPNGWGASLSFLPVEPVPGSGALATFRRLQQLVVRNESVFEQPAVGPAPVPGPYILFVCQLPHDETIRFHSSVGVETALAATIAYAEHRGLTLVVKGHPANPRSMAPLKALTETRRRTVWVDSISIHSCLAHADRVFLVNSGVGMEALLHEKPIVRFGHAEYDSVVPWAEPSLESIMSVEHFKPDLDTYSGFLDAYVGHCICENDFASYSSALKLGTR